MTANTNISENPKESKEQSVLKAAWIIAVITIVSKMIGFIRDIVVADVYGASTVSDAYYYAYQIPSLAIVLLGGIGGPFHSATVAVFTKMIPSLKEKPSEEVNRLFNTFLTATFLFFVVVSVLLFIYATPVMKFIISDSNPTLVALAGQHLRIMSPVLISGGLVGIYYGILICYKEFALPNFSPMVMSIIIIAMILMIPDHNGYVLAVATTIGAVCQFLLQLPRLHQIGFRFKPNLDFFNNPNFHSICELLFPAVLSSTVGQIHIYVDMFFASSLKEGAWTAIGYANRIFQFPVGILVTAFLVPLFPIFSKLVFEKDFDGIRNYFNKGVGVLFFAAIPILISIVVVGYDGISLIFKHGAFDSKDAFMVTEALWFLSVSIIPYVFRDSITRVYYSFNDSATPFIVAFSSIILKFFLNWLLVAKIHLGESGIGGITLSTSLVTLFNGVVLGYLIRKKMHMDYRRLFKNLGIMCLTGLVTAFICGAVYFGMGSLNIPEIPLEISRIIIVGTICFATYTYLNIVFKMEYAVELQSRFVGKIKSKFNLK